MLSFSKKLNFKYFAGVLGLLVAVVVLNWDAHNSHNAFAQNLSTLNLFPVADTYVRSDSPGSNYGNSSSMYTDGSPIKASYLKFDLVTLAGKNIISAKLRIKVSTDSSTASQSLKKVADTAWSETSLNYNNRPTPNSLTIGTISSGNTTNTWQEVDVTPTIKTNSGNLISFAIVQSSSLGINFYTKESSNNKPQLVVQYEIAPTPTPTLVPTFTPTPTISLEITPTPTESETITPTPTEPTELPTPTPTISSPITSVVVAVAGDIACGTSTTPLSNDCYQSRTADLVTQIAPSRVFALGDTQYNSGEYSKYLTYYEPSWGRFKTITDPVVGNHEYGTSGARGYFDYFNGVGNFSGPAGDRDKAYYSFDIGNWHIVALNSECSKVSCSTGSAQETWLRQDLTNNTKLCTAVMWHKQFFTSGSTGPNSASKPLVQAMYDHNVDLLLGGHNHYYERFRPQDPNYNLDTTRGITSITVGTGGSALSGVGNTSFKNAAIRNGKTWGVLKLSLNESTWDWNFLPVPGQTFTDAGTGSCH